MPHTATDLVELTQLTVMGLATLASGVALGLYLRTWRHIVLLDTDVDRKTRIAAFAAVGREVLRFLFCVFLCLTALVAYLELPAPPAGMPYQDWILARKASFLGAGVLLLLMVAWDFWLRDTQRKAKARYP